MSPLEFSLFVIAVLVSSKDHMLGIQNSKTLISNFAC